MSELHSTDLEQIEAMRRLNTHLATTLNSVDALAQARDKATATRAVAEAMVEQGLEPDARWVEAAGDPDACDAQIVILLMTARRLIVRAARGIAEITTRASGAPSLNGTAKPKPAEEVKAPPAEPEVEKEADEADELVDVEVSEEA